MLLTAANDVDRTLLGQLVVEPDLCIDALAVLGTLTSILLGVAHKHGGPPPGRTLERIALDLKR
jgi:hypothetical protein